MSRLRPQVEATMTNADGERGWIVWGCCCNVREFNTWGEAFDHALSCGGAEVYPA